MGEIVKIDKMGNLKNIVQKLAVYLLILFIAFAFLLPVSGVFTTSFRPNSDIIKNGFWVFPDPPELVNFAEVLTGGKIQLFFKNTFVVTIAATFIYILLGMLTGYAFGKLRFKFSDTIFIIVIAVHVFPSSGCPYSHIQAV